MRDLDIAGFAQELDDLVERTSGRASYLELIGVLEVTKHRLLQEFLDDVDVDDDDDEYEEDDDDEYEEDDDDR
jgi:hypothetical protein